MSSYYNDIDDSSTVEQNVSAVETPSYKPASRLLPSPAPRKLTPEPVSYHLPSPTPSPRKRLMEEEGHATPSPIAPIRQQQRREGATVQRTSTTLSTTLPIRTNLHMNATPSPIAPIRQQQRREGSTVQRTSTTLSTTLPIGTNLHMNGGGGGIKDEWLQAYAGATVPPGMIQKHYAMYSAYFTMEI
jgi:hypothetical protein